VPDERCHSWVMDHLLLGRVPGLTPSGAHIAYNLMSNVNP